MLASVNPPTGQAGAHAVQDRLVQVGLGVEVPVEDHPGDAGLDGDVVQARRREPAARERLGRGGEDLLPALRAGQAAQRLRRLPGHDDPPSSCLLPSVLSRIYTFKYTIARGRH